MERNRNLEYYLQLEYPITLYRAEEGGYVAEIEDLPGCITEGETLDEVYANIEQARLAWIEVAYDDELAIPLPRNEQEYSGRFLVRIPKSLHRRLAEQAKREGVSLNQYAEVLLSTNLTAASAKPNQILINSLKQVIKEGITTRQVFRYRTSHYIGQTLLDQETIENYVPQLELSEEYSAA